MTSGKPCKINLEAFGGEGTIRSEVVGRIEESEYHLSTERERVAALRQEIADARAALGEGWLAGGVSMAEGIRRKTRALESELASDHCAEREACAQVVESTMRRHPGQRETDDSGHDEVLSYAAECIRARGKSP